MAAITASVFVGVSVDGFIARRNGEFDFLPEGGGEPHGYDEFMAGIDTLVIGRKLLNRCFRIRSGRMEISGLWF